MIRHEVRHKGYVGIAERDAETGAWFGRVVNVNLDIITFQGANVEEASRSFRDSVDDYLDFCASRGEEPEVPSETWTRHKDS